MADPRFVHLRVHSEYSIVDGLLRLDDAIEHAARDAMPALALTDLGNLFGLVKFYRAARARGVKPIVGVDAWVAPDGDRAQAARLLLLVQGQQGYRRLCELISAAYLSGTGRERAEIPRGALLSGDT
ncbi:partial DNA polymerase III subunit alpha, partial [Anaerolineae bacterium]